MSINLLPWRQTQRELKYNNLKHRIVLFSIFLFFLSISIKLFFYWDIKQIHIKTIKINQQLLHITFTDPLHKNKTLLKKLIYFHAQRQSSKKENIAIQNILLSIANTIPSSITLSQLQIDPKKISMTGSSNKLTDIHQYINALQKKQIGKKIELTDIQVNKDNHSTMQFVIKINREQPHDKQRI